MSTKHSVERGSSSGSGWLSRRVSRCIAACLLLAGCATYQTAATNVADAIEGWQRPRLAHAASQPAAAQAPLPGSQITPSPPPASPLDRYLLDALERNPSVKAATAAAQARLARIPQVTSLADPMLRTITRPEPIQTAAGDMYFTLGVSQKIPLPARLDRAGKAAAAEVRIAIEQLNATRLRVIADVERAYYRLYITDRSIELTEANRALLADLEQVVASQYRVGLVQQHDVLRVQTELTSLLNELYRLRQQRVSAVAALNQLMDRDPAGDLPVTEPVDPAMIEARAGELVALAEQHNPELAMLEHQAERDRQRVALADLGYWPDLDIGFDWTYARGRDAWIPPRNPQTGMRPPINRKSEAGDDNWALMVGVNLPIWTQRVEGARREARRELDKTLHEHRAARNMVAFRIHDASARVRTRHETIQLLESTLIPQARQAYEVSQTAYQAGHADFLDVIDNWRQELAFELMLHREVAELQIACSELEREVGAELIRGSPAAGEAKRQVQP